MWNSLLIESAKSLTVGLNNLRVIDLTLLRSSRMSLTILGMNLLLEGLSEPSIKYKSSTVIMVSDFVSDGSIKIITIGSVCLVGHSRGTKHGKAQSGWFFRKSDQCKFSVSGR